MRCMVWKKFKALLIKELLEERGWILFFGGGIILFDIYIFTRINVWDKGVASPISLVFPLTAIFFLSLIRGYNSFREEWNRNTQHLLLSLPVKGYIPVLTKFLAILIELVLLALLSFLLSFIVFKLDINDTFFSIKDWINLYLIFIISTFPFISLTMLVYLVSRCVRRLRWLVTLLTAIGIYIFIVKTLPMGERLLSFIPTPHIGNQTLKTSDGVVLHTATISAGIYYFALIGIITLPLCSFIYDRWVEA